MPFSYYHLTYLLLLISLVLLAYAFVFINKYGEEGGGARGRQAGRQAGRDKRDGGWEIETE